MSLPLAAPPPPPPPPAAAAARPYYHGRGGSYAAAIAAVAALGVAAGIVGRLCTGRTIWGLGFRRLDLEAWVERRCAPCLDGRPPPPPPPPAAPPPES